MTKNTTQTTQESTNNFGLSVNNLGVTLNNTNILADVSLQLNNAEIGCLLGPSGCGKTTLLRTVAGFIAPTEGSIDIKGQTVSTNKSLVAVEQRQVGMVFQDFALFPHLSVFDNITFGLKNLKQNKSEQKLRAEELLELIELSDKANSYPHELSGGQQQRVALARALAPKPSIILLDEPFSSIDRSMRDNLAFKVREILKKEQATTIMVTHDQSEAYAMADKIGVVNKGKLLQWDTPLSIYHSPNEKFVAQFIGESTFLQGTVTSTNTLQTVLGNIKISEVFQTGDIGQTRELLIRPDEVIYDAQSPTKATVMHQFFKGTSFIYLLKLINDETLYAQFSTKLDLQVDMQIGIRIEECGVSF